MKRYIKAKITDVLDEDRYELTEIAKNVVNPADLDRLARVDMDDYMLCYEVARNPNTELETLEYLMDSPAMYVRDAIARHRNVSVDLLRRLADDSYGTVQFAVLTNPKVPKDIIEKLAHSDDASVQIEALKKLGYKITTDEFGHMHIDGELLSDFRKHL